MSLLFLPLLILRIVTLPPMSTTHDPWPDASVRISESTWDSVRAVAALYRASEARSDSLLAKVSALEADVAYKDKVVMYYERLEQEARTVVKRVEKQRNWSFLGGFLAATIGQWVGSQIYGGK